MIKAGICGFAHGHVFSFTKEWLRTPEKYDIAVTGAWDHDSARLRESLEKNYPGVDIRAYESLDELLKSDIDAVVVTSEKRPQRRKRTSSFISPWRCIWPRPTAS